MDVEQVTASEAHHGEGPVWGEWAPGDVGLRYVDMLRGDVLALDTDSGKVRRIPIGTVAATVRPRTTGGMVAAVERSFALVSPDGQVQPLGELWPESDGIRFNEGGTDPDGRFYCGSMAYDKHRGAASMYRLDPDGTTTKLYDGVTISNGLAWSPTGETVYYIDTPTRNVDAFDYSAVDGIIAESRRTVFSIPEDVSGGPDGMTVDVEGGLWIAFFGGSSVRRYQPDGTLDEVVPVPPRQVTACTFGGPGLDELYITTSREGLPPDAEPAAGAVFRARPGVRGNAALPFAG